MPSVIEIYRLALDQASTRATVDSLDENTPEAKACGRWYDIVLRQIFRAVWWNFARRTVALENKTVMTIGPWAYRYAKPNDMIAARYLLEYRPFVVEGQFIKTNVDNAVLVYTSFVSDPDEWDDSFIPAFIHGLAGAIIIPLVGDRVIANDQFAKANTFLTQARIDNAMEPVSLTMMDQMPDWLIAREYTVTPLEPFVMGLGPLFVEM